LNIIHDFFKRRDTEVVICIILVPLKRATRVLKIPKGGNQNSLVEEEQTTQWLKEKVQMDKQRSTKHIHKNKDQVKTGGELRCSVMVSSSCSTSGTHRVNLAKLCEDKSLIIVLFLELNPTNKS
jgi:hypothetical protein